jgi:outer membrane protein
VDEGDATRDPGGFQARLRPDTVPPETPRIVAAERAVAVARAQVARAKAARLPSLKGTAGLLNYASGAGVTTTEWQAGLAISWPIFTGGARGASIEAAEARLARAEEQLRLARLDQEDSAESAEAELTRGVTRLAAANDARDQWEEVARIEALRMENGAGIQSDLLMAQARLFQARADVARTRNDIVLARVRMARADGTLTRDWLDNTLEAQP